MVYAFLPQPLLKLCPRPAPDIMIAISILGFLLVRSLDDKHNKLSNAKLRIKWAYVGALGHAAGHIILAVNKRRGLLPSGDVSAMDELLADDCNFLTYAKHLPGFLLFWIPLVKTYMYNVSLNNVACMAFVIMLGAMQLPLKFGFSYTLVVLFGGQSLDQLFLPRQQKETIEYMLWPLITMLPTLCLSVMESWFCTNGFAFAEHGHVVFDGYIASSYGMYYLVCWQLHKSNAASKKTV